MTLPFVTGVAVANSGVTLMARVVGSGGVLITAASLSGITYAVTDLTTNTTLGTGNMTVSSASGGVVYDSLQQSDPRWSKDSAANPSPPPPRGDGRWGYNFLWTVPATLIPQSVGGHRIQVDIAFTPLTGQPWRVPFSFVPQPVYG